MADNKHYVTNPKTGKKEESFYSSEREEKEAEPANPLAGKGAQAKADPNEPTFSSEKYPGLPGRAKYEADLRAYRDKKERAQKKATENLLNK